MRTEPSPSLCSAMSLTVANQFALYDALSHSRLGAMLYLRSEGDSRSLRNAVQSHSLPPGRARSVTLKATRGREWMRSLTTKSPKTYRQVNPGREWIRSPCGR